ncbi:Protein ALP1-like [Anabarilius grahami]|uniref:Putative nuclease HARBI1 n=1 Tax=Anabarilius grahami TaxID=495550 RepID=A0A3N0YVM1_ANAGA|nr:Protein ALP1-like [Anabarilius grahami]
MAGVVHRHHHFARRGYRQRVYVERTKPLEQYTTEELYVRFRFGKADIEYLVNLLRPKLQHRTQRSHGLSVEDQSLIALRFYACGTFYQVVGDYMGVVKSAVCDVVRDVSIALASLVNEFVSFPKDNQIAQAKRSFFLLGNMPNTIGAIDCTHVHIQAPRENEWEFINRKGRHSINVQLVCDADLIITNCVVKWPGSVHDARILRESALYRDLQTNRPDGIILGDSAYPLLPRLMTPFLTENTPAQARFNTAHCRARCAIERLNGVLKRRFACLKLPESGTTESMQHNPCLFENHSDLTLSLIGHVLYEYGEDELVGKFEKVLFSLNFPGAGESDRMTMTFVFDVIASGGERSSGWCRRAAVCLGRASRRAPGERVKKGAACGRLDERFLSVH